MVKIVLDDTKALFRLRLCVSPDTSNSVFVSAPLEHDALKLAIENETALLIAR
jgi:hypothetical protein